MAETYDPLKPWREALAAGQQSFLTQLADQAVGGPQPQFADWWSKLGGATNLGRDPSQQYLAACDQFFRMSGTYLEQFMQQGAGATADPARRAQEFATKVAGWFAEHQAVKFSPFGSWLEMPALGATRDQQLIWQRISELAKQFQEQQSALAAEWAKVGAEAAKTFGEELAAAQAGGRSIHSLKELYDRWIDRAEEAYSSQVHQSSYAALLAQLTNTLNALRTEQRSLVESWAKHIDLPSRAEINTLHERVNALRTELAALREEPKPAKRRPPPPRPKPGDAA
jgi:class III poly(R)-hydroxyalkanoic acid synthase PhaE subunit